MTAAPTVPTAAPTVRTAAPSAAAVCCAPLAAPSLTLAEAEATAGLFKALADPHRVRIVNQLATKPEPVCACEFEAPLGLSQPTVSHHLRKLTDAGLLRREQRGKWAYYTLDPAAARRLAAVVDLGDIAAGDRTASATPAGPAASVTAGGRTLPAAPLGGPC